MRVELGPRDLQKNQFVAVSRDNNAKETVSLNDADKKIMEIMDTIHTRMLQT